jgi:hypothetical protein
MLHIIAPTHQTTSTSLFRLMRLTIRQLHQLEHCVIIIGNESDAIRCRNQGVPVLGSIGGSRDASKTLRGRLLKFMKQSNQSYSEKIMSWGWHAMTASSDCAMEFDAYAVIDEMEIGAPCSSVHTVIPTNETAVRGAIRVGLQKAQFTEPLVGVEPTTAVAERSIVFDLLQISNDGLLVSIVGDTGSWQSILAMADRFKASKQQVNFVLPPMYRDRATLMRLANERGMAEMVHDVPVKLRNVDVLHAADCAWCPEVAPHDTSSNVLDVLFAAWELTPLAVMQTHPIASIPPIGSQIAWGTDDVSVFCWMLDLKNSNTLSLEQCAERVVTVRSITSPSRFIEGLQLRMHAV